jgi:hypothetical protein
LNGSGIFELRSGQTATPDGAIRWVAWFFEDAIAEWSLLYSNPDTLGVLANEQRCGVHLKDVSRNVEVLKKMISK